MMLTVFALTEDIVAVECVRDKFEQKQVSSKFADKPQVRGVMLVYLACCRKTIPVPKITKHDKSA